MRNAVRAHKRLDPYSWEHSGLGNPTPGSSPPLSSDGHRRGRCSPLRGDSPTMPELRGVNQGPLDQAVWGLPGDTLDRKRLSQEDASGREWLVTKGAFT